MRDRSELRPGQVASIDHIFARDEGFLIGECGFGKTAVLLTTILDWFAEDVLDHVILAAPPLVARSVWPAEPAKWAHLKDMVLIDGTGTPKQRQKAFREWLAERGRVLLVTTPNIATIEKELRAFATGRLGLVIDEVSMLKAPTGTLSKAAEKLADRAAICWGGTATPRPNGWEDLFRPVRIVTRGGLWGGTGGFEKWRAERFMPLDRNGYNWRVHTFAEREMEAQLAPLFYVAPVDEIKGLGELRQGEGFDRRMDLPDAARGIYDKMEEELFAKVLPTLAGATDEEIVFALSKAAASAKLEQLAQGYIYDEGAAFSEVHDAKLTALDALLEEIGPKENVIIVYRFKHDVVLLRRLLGDFPVLGGEATPKAKAEAMAAWNGGKLRFLGLHPASAGHGVELQGGGRRIITFCPTWSAEQAHQTTRRVYRSGLQGHCYHHRLVMRKTVDELKVARVDNNIAEQTAFLDARR